MATASFNEESKINVNLQNTNQINATMQQTETSNVDLPPINYIPGYKEAETQRRANEEIRQSNEEDRISLYEDVEQKLESGYFDGEDGYSPTATVSKTGKVATITITDKNGTTTATVSDGQDSSGDMLKSVYDTNNNGIVDNAEKVNNHSVESDVPSGAVFTDTTYTAGTGIDITNNVISNTQTSAEWGNITGTLSNQTDLNNALSSKADSSNTYTKTEVDNLIDNINSFNIEIVQTLPVSDIDPHTIYLVPKTGSTGDAYNEYVYINNNWELIGNTEIDLTDYVKFTNYASNQKGGVIKTDTSTYGTSMYNGFLTGSTRTYAQYGNAANALFVSKGTLENVIDGKGLVDTTDLASKQDTLVSGTNIKTINNTTILGSGNIDTNIPQQATPPVNPVEGDLWIDTDDDSSLIGVKSTFTTSDSDTYSCNYINNALIDVFVGGEVKTNRVWINNKPIYRKVIKSTSTISANANPNIPLGLDITTIDDFTKIETIAKQKGVNVWFTASTNNSASDRLSHYINGNNLTIRNSWDFDKLIIILEYTKTTDSGEQ